MIRPFVCSLAKPIQRCFLHTVPRTIHCNYYCLIYRPICSIMAPSRTTSSDAIKHSSPPTSDAKSGVTNETKRQGVKRTTSSKRKIQSEDENTDTEAKPAKKARPVLSKQHSSKLITSGEIETASNGQPTNKTLPEDINFPSKKEGTLRIVAWNICGLASASKKGFKTYVEREDADILVLTETKVNDKPLDPMLTSRYPHQHWSISSKKTYSGTAILSKVKPLSVDDTLPGHPDPTSVKGRIVTLEFESLYLVGTYVVNAGAGLKTLDAKKEWNKHFEKYIQDLDKKKPVIWTGDLNVAPTAMDLANPKPNWNKTPGYTEAETSSFARVLNPPDKEGGKMIDMWRHLHPDLKYYTYFSYRFNCRAKGIGWRLDTFVLSERIKDRVEMCEIRSEIYGASDHCPIVLEISRDL